MKINKEALSNLEGSVENLQKLNETLTKIEDMLQQDIFYTGLDKSSQMKFYGDYDNALTQFIFIVYSTRMVFTVMDILEKPNEPLLDLCSRIITHPEDLDKQRDELEELGSVEGEIQDEILYNELYVRIYRNVFGNTMKIEHNYLTMCQAARYIIHKHFDTVLEIYKTMHKEDIV